MATPDQCESLLRFGNLGTLRVSTTLGEAMDADLHPAEAPVKSDARATLCPAPDRADRSRRA